MWDVHGLLRRITWIQLREWMEFYRLEPWGDAVEEHRVARLQQTVVAVNTVKGRPPPVDAFLPARVRHGDIGRDVAPMTASDFREFKGWMAVHAGGRG